MDQLVGCERGLDGVLTLGDHVPDLLPGDKSAILVVVLDGEVVQHVIAALCELVKWSS